MIGRLLTLIILLRLGLHAPTLLSQDISNPGGYSQLEASTKDKAKQKIHPLMEKYCGEFCELVNVKVEIREKIQESQELGFENTAPGGAATTMEVQKITPTIQIDERVGNVNKTRFHKLLNIHLKSLAKNVEVIWQEVRLPRITRYGEGQPGYIFDAYGDENYQDGKWDFRPQEYTGAALKLRTKLETQLQKTINSVIQRYCPNQCILENIDIQGGMVEPRDTLKLDRSQQIRDRSGRLIFQIDNIDINVAMDAAMSESERQKITGVMQSKVRFASPVNINLGVLEFPETFAEKSAKASQNLEDPYGLEKLRNMLTMFRDLAGTKEIIQTTKETSESNTDTKNALTKSLENIQENNNRQLTSEETVLLVFGVLLLLTILGYVFSKIRRNQLDAQEMLRQQAIPAYVEPPKEEKTQEEQTLPETSTENKEDLALNFKIQEIKDELTSLFMENPKVARDTFSRFIKEDGIEETAKYVQVFGHMIIFELLKDPNLQRELYELSEYYHNSDFQFAREEEYNLLVKLKTRCTASEIRVLTRRATEKFDFLSKLDPQQIYALIRDEKMQVQAIVLTQLDRKKRENVFAMYVGEDKVALMSELSMAEAIPKEFLFNVAKALNKKVSSRPEFDTENLRTSDILLDLMEKAPLEEQMDLMRTLHSNNPETARSLKLKLVTIFMLPYLKAGHLLELILGMDREDLLIFLMGVSDDIRDLILRKAPEELADSWIEDMDMMAATDEQSYRIVEMKVLNKIRSLAHNGIISLLEINEMIFSEVIQNDYLGDAEPVPELNSAIEAA